LLCLVAAAFLLAGCVKEGNPNDTWTQGWNNNMWQLRKGQPVDATGTLGGTDTVDNWLFHTDLGVWNVEAMVGAHEWMNWSAYFCQGRIYNSSGEITGCDNWLTLGSGTLGSANSTTSTSGLLGLIGFPCSGPGCSTTFRSVIRIKLDSTTSVHYGVHLQVG
jgi:hypothetical protein